MKHIIKTLMVALAVTVYVVSLPATAQTTRQNAKKQMAKAVINGSKGNVTTVTSTKPKVKAATEAKSKSPSKAKETNKAKTKETSQAKATATTASSKAKNKEINNSATKYVITENGIGPILLGINCKSLPASVPGLYTRKAHQVPTEEEIEESWYYFQGWMFYDEKDNEVISVEEDDDGIGYLIVVHSNKFQMENGMHVGMTQKQVESYKGVKKIVPGEWEDYPRLRYEIGKITLLMDWEDGKTVQGIEITKPE